MANEISRYAMENAYKGVERAALDRAKELERPEAVVLGGQPGSGKAVLSAQAVREFSEKGGSVVIDADRMREENPRYRQLSREDPQNAADRSHKDAAEWSTRLTMAAIEGRRNVVIDGTLRDPENVRDITTRLKDAGYTVEARVIAVSPEASMARARLRYEQGVEANGTGRFVNQEQHDRAFNGIPRSVEAMERDKLVDSLKIYDGQQRSIYENAQEKGEWRSRPEGAAALEQERSREWSHAEQRQYVDVLSEVSKLAKERLSEPDRSIEAKLERAKGDLSRLEDSPAFQRAEAFSGMQQREALAKFPELDGAYAQLREARQQDQAQGTEAKERAAFAAREAIAERLQRGEIPSGPVSRTESAKVIELAASERGIKSIRDADVLQRDVKGEVVATTSHHVLIKLSGDVGVRVERENLSREVTVGEKVAIAYDSKNSQVADLSKDAARDLAKDQGRGFDR